MDKKFNIVGRSKRANDSLFLENVIPFYQRPNYSTNWFPPDTEERFKTKTYPTNYTKESIVYKFNEFGWRSDDFSVNQKDIRIIILGDSFSMGVGIPFEHLWFNQMTDVINKEYGINNIKWYNFSMPTMTNQDLSVILNQVVDIIKPHLVILFGPTWFSSSIYTTESLDNSLFSTDVFNVKLAAKYPCERLEWVTDYSAPQIAPKKHQLESCLNPTTLFFDSLRNFLFMRRICSAVECDFLYDFSKFRLPYKNLVNEDLPELVKEFIPNFHSGFLNIPREMLVWQKIGEAARDGIHIPFSGQKKIMEEIFKKMKENEIFEKWKLLRN